MIRAAVLGKPIHHSLSPLVHGFIYRELGLDYDYGIYEVDEGEAERFITGSFSVENPKWSGFSLTMPLKEVGFSLPFPVEARALEARSINTVTPAGSFNTDISGLERILRLEKLEPTLAIVLGNGATARSALLALDSLTALSEVTLFRRNNSRDGILPLNRRVPVKIQSIDELSARHLHEKTLIVSTIPGSSQSAFSSYLSGFNGTLIDFSYAPWPSVLAGAVAGRVISGLPLLVSQAIDQARIFTGVDFDGDLIFQKVLTSTVKSIASAD